MNKKYPIIAALIMGLLLTINTVGITTFKDCPLFMIYRGLLAGFGIGYIGLMILWFGRMKQEEEELKDEIKAKIEERKKGDRET